MEEFFKGIKDAKEKNRIQDEIHYEPQRTGYSCKVDKNIGKCIPDKDSTENAGKKEYPFLYSCHVHTSTVMAVLLKIKYARTSGGGFFTKTVIAVSDDYKI
jgi:hypothetical protein